MTQVFRAHFRAISIATCTLLLFVAGCSKKPTLPPPSTYTPPPSATKPTASISADRTNINRGDSVKLSWTTTDAPNVSIVPEVGAVTAQGSTTVTPGDSTTYTITASNAAGNADASVRITVASAAPPPAESSLSGDELFYKEVRDAYFDYDSAEIRPDARQNLAKTADFLKANPSIRVNIEGHCDERGSTEYNLVLGDRRAAAVKSYLVSLGISADRMNTVSYGKEKPFCADSNEECWQKNRVGHFVKAI